MMKKKFIIMMSNKTSETMTKQEEYQYKSKKSA